MIEATRLPKIEPFPPHRTFVWTPEAEALICLKSTVAAAVELGIPAADVRRRKTTLRKRQAAGGSKRRWTSAEDAMLGTVPDAVLARRLIRTVEAVKTRRKRASVRLPAALYAQPKSRKPQVVAASSPPPPIPTAEAAGPMRFSIDVTSEVVDRLAELVLAKLMDRLKGGLA